MPTNRLYYARPSSRFGRISRNMNPIQEMPVSVEVYEEAQRKIVELESENRRLRDSLRSYELLAKQNANSTDSSPLVQSSKENLMSEARIKQLHERKKTSAIEAQEAAGKLQAMLEACQKRLAAVPDVEEVISEDGLSFNSPLTTQESDLYPDDSFEA